MNLYVKELKLFIWLKCTRVEKSKCVRTDNELFSLFFHRALVDDIVNVSSTLVKLDFLISCFYENEFLVTCFNFLFLVIELLRYTNNLNSVSSWKVNRCVYHEKFVWIFAKTLPFFLAFYSSLFYISLYYLKFSC